MIGVTLDELRAARYRPRRGPVPAVECPIAARIADRLSPTYGSRRVPLVELVDDLPPLDVLRLLDLRWIEGGREAARELAARCARRIVPLDVGEDREVLLAALDSGEAPGRRVFWEDDTPRATRWNLAVHAVIVAISAGCADTIGGLLDRAVVVHGPDERAAQRVDLLDVLRRPVVVEVPEGLRGYRVSLAELEAAGVAVSTLDLPDGWTRTRTQPQPLATWIRASSTPSGWVDVLRAVVGGGELLREVALLAYGRHTSAASSALVGLRRWREVLSCAASAAADYHVERAAQRADLLSLLEVPR